MDDILILDAIERYRSGDMTPQEKLFLEELRKNNPDIDQMAVEHIFFLQQMEKVADTRALKNSLNEVESKLITEGVIAKKELSGRAKIVYLWNRYRRVIAVAASIAVLVSLFTVGMVSIYTGTKDDPKITQLKAKIDATDKDIKKLKTQISNAVVEDKPIKKTFEANFRATGFLIDGSGYIATNAHVINNAKNLVVENKKGEQFIAVPLYVDKESDLAILKIRDTSFKRIPVLPYTFRKTSPELGEHIFTLGYPKEEVVYSEGYVSAKSGYSGDTLAYQVSIAVNRGNSGSPVLNKNGEVIGIISSKETDAADVVFSIKSKNIFLALEKIGKEDDIKLSSRNSLKGLDREQQIMKMQECVFMVKGN